MANMSKYRIVTITDLALIHDVAGTATAVDLSFGNKAAFKNELKTITYEGDGQEAKKFIMAGCDIDIESDDYDELALELIFGKVTVTASLPSGVAARTYWGANADSAGMVCGIQVACTAEDLATGINKTLHITAPKGTLSSPEPPDVQNLKKAGMKLKFSAKKTTTDISGVALPGVPADGCFYWVEVLTASP